jgi:hypothetical protein
MEGIGASLVLAALTIIVVVANTMIIIVFRKNHAKMKKRYNLK